MPSANDFITILFENGYFFLTTSFNFNGAADQYINLRRRIWLEAVILPQAG